MAVYIRKMEMPSSCSVCDFLEYAGGDYQPWVVCRLTEENLEDPNSRGDECPLVEIKEPHGDLIDKDAFLRDFHIEGTVTGKENAIMMQNMLNETLQAVADSPTVIERSEDD